MNTARRTQQNPYYGQVHYLKKIKSRTKDLKDIWKPIGVLISVVTALSSARRFYTKTGPYFLGSAALLAMAVLILYTVPIVSVRLFVKRVVGFWIDILTCALLTIGASWLLFEGQAAKPSAVVSMAIVWAWVFYFIMLDWRFEGTPGTLAVGLRIKGHDSEPSLLACTGRNLCVLVVPFLLAGSILSTIAKTEVRSSELWSFALTILFFFPLSIIFTGGQSLVDIVFGLSVLPRRSRKDQYPVKITIRDVLWLLLTTSLAGTVLGFMPSVFHVARSQIVALQETRASDQLTSETYISGQEDQRMAAHVWPHLRARFPIADGVLQDVRVYSAYGKLPVPEDENPDLYETSCGESYRSRRTFKVIRLQFQYGTPEFIESDMMASLFGAGINYSGRPSFLVVEVAERDHFGVFMIEKPEDDVFCFGGSDANPQNSLVYVRVRMRVQSSINEIAWLLLGKFDNFSSVEHLPVFPTP